MSTVVWPKPPRSYESRSRHRYVVQVARTGNSPWSDIESYRWRWVAVLNATVASWSSSRWQVLDRQPAAPVHLSEEDK